MLIFLAIACTSDTPDCPDCPACPEAEVAAPAADGGALADWEQALLQPTIDDLRAGVRPWDEQGLGVCMGDRECDAFVGLDAGDLAEGDHLIKAELAVPQLGEGWQVKFEVACEVTLPNGSTKPVDHEKVYDVTWTGPKRGYRLMPLWRIQSPHPQGSRDCEYRLTPLRPDGSAGEAITGHYKTPMPEGT